MAQPNVGDLVTTTLLNRAKMISDNVTNNNALLYELNRSGRIQTAGGGRELLCPLSYDNNQTFKWYSGMETLDVAPYRVHDSASYQWKQAAVAVTVSGLEADVINSGQEQVFDLVAERVTVAEDTMANGISAGVYSDGTGSGGKEIGGLQYLIADDPTTGVVGGIDPATYSWWQNESFAGVSDGGAAVDATTIQSYMNQVWYATTRGRDKPNLIVAANDYYGFYESSLQEIKRITNDNLANAGFQNIAYKTANVVLDGGYNGGCPDAHMYFINTKFLKYRPHTRRNMVPLSGERYSVNQDASTTLIVFAGNLVMGNRFTQGVLIA